jgi:hypothetical protein
MYGLPSFALSFLSWWFALSIGARWAYGSAFIVLVGVVGESVADLTNWIKDTKLKKRVEIISALVLIVGLTGDLISIGIGQREFEALTTEAGDAKRSADAAADDAVRAKTSADQAQNKAESVFQRTEKLSQDLDKDEQGLTRLEGNSSRLKTSLENLAVCSAPRVLELWSVVIEGARKTTTDSLKPYAGRQAIIEYLPDPEALRAASNVRAALEDAGWHIFGFTRVDEIRDGVEIQAYMGKLPDSQDEARQESEAHSRGKDAAEALRDFLRSYNWQATEGDAMSGPTDIPRGGVKIRVGLYPPVTFVTPPGARDVMAKFAQDLAAQRAKLRAEHDREVMKGMTKELAAQWKAGSDRREREEKHQLEQYRGPCHPLSSPAVRLITEK